MKSGPFLSLISSTYGLPDQSVVVVARALREAGWLTSGARGVNAPDMTLLDAARLSLALLTGEPPSKVVAEFEFLRTLQAEADYPAAGLVSCDELPAGHNLEEAITALFTASADVERVAAHGEVDTTHVMTPDAELADGYDLNAITHIVWPKFSVAVDMSQRTAAVRVPQETFHYLDLGGREKFKQLRAKRPMDLNEMEELIALGNRSPSTAEMDGVAEGRGMRVVRTITEQEFKGIVEAMQVRAPPAQLSHGN